MFVCDSYNETITDKGSIQAAPTLLPQQSNQEQWQEIGSVRSQGRFPSLLFGRPRRGHKRSLCVSLTWTTPRALGGSQSPQG